METKDKLSNKRRQLMKYDKIIGLEKNISKLIMGNDNQTNYDEASMLWDHWVEVGGNAFDNAHVYGGGSVATAFSRNELLISWIDDCDQCLWFQIFNKFYIVLK